MLPLLDVFMVILFVFATIQEGQLDETTQEFEAQARALSESQTQAAALQERIDEAQIENTAATLQTISQELQDKKQELEKVHNALSEASQERARLETVAEHVSEKLNEIEATAKAAILRTYDSDDAFRQQNVLDKLLDQNSVFEVEIRGELTPEMGIVNHCCFRNDPRAQRWHSCGIIPAVSAEREEWFRLGGDGLESALRNTKGGNAMTIVRQDSAATYLIGAKIKSLVREQIPEQKVYDEGITFVDVHCP